MSYKIEEIEGIGPSYASKLADAQIQTTDDLLTKCCTSQGRKTTSESSETGTGLKKPVSQLVTVARVSASKS